MQVASYGVVVRTARSRAPRLVWVYPDVLARALNAAPKLEVTRELRRAGWRVDLLVADAPGHDAIQGVEVTAVPRPDVYLLRQVVFHVRACLLLLRQGDGVDIVLFEHLSLPWMLLLRLWRTVSRRDRPLFVMDTRSVPMESAESERRADRARSGFGRVMDRLAHRFADGETAITRRMAVEIGVPPGKLWGTWPSGVNLARFETARRQREWPAPGCAVHVVYLGALHEARHLAQLCTAVERANLEGMSFVLTLRGDGTQREALAAVARDSGGSIRLHRPVPHAEVPAVLAREHVGALPFPDEVKFRVSSPIKLFEYMGAGMPVLATRVTCHTDVIGEGDYAFWAEDASAEALLDALREVWRHRRALEAMGAEAARAAQAWSWQASADRLRAALEAGLARHGAADGEA